MSAAASLVALLVASSTGGVLEDIDSLDRKLSASERELRRLDEDAARVAGAVVDLETRVAQLSLREREAFDQLKKRLRALYRMPLGSRLALLGGSDSLADLLRTTRLLRAVARHDRRIQESYTNARGDLEPLRTALAEQQKKTETLVAAVAQRRNDLAAQRAERLALVQAALADPQRRAALAQERSAAGKTLLTLLARTQNPRSTSTFAKGRGSLSWPVAGKVVVSFGATDGTATTVASQGVFFSAVLGSEVRAVGEGEVRYADWLTGFGHVVLVEHDRTHHTVYAHLAELQVATGAEVAAGTVLGTVGESGSTGGPGLYFELRSDGTPADPMAWLKRG